VMSEKEFKGDEAAWRIRQLALSPARHR
jgi:hypothetical protein